MGDYADEMDKKRKALEELLQFLREKGGGSCSTADYNAAIAENETAWEIGAFGEGAPVGEDRTPAGIIDGLVIRTRREALTAQLNSAKILDLLEANLKGDKSALHKQLQTIKIACLLTFGLVVGMTIDRFF
jgi:hypothetical protein